MYIMAEINKIDHNELVYGKYYEEIISVKLIAIKWRGKGGQ